MYFWFKVMISVPFLTLKWSNFINICYFDDIFTSQPWSLVWVQSRINLILLNLISNILLQYLILFTNGKVVHFSSVFFVNNVTKNSRNWMDATVLWTWINVDAENARAKGRMLISSLFCCGNKKYRNGKYCFSSKGHDNKNKNNI